MPASRELTDEYNCRWRSQLSVRQSTANVSVSAARGFLPVGAVGHAPGVPVWGMPTVYANPNGNFTIVY